MIRHHTIYRREPLMPDIRRRSRLVFVSSLAIVTLSAAACSSDSGPKGTASSSGSAGGSSVGLPSKITIGYQQIPNGDLVVKNKKLLEKAFGDKVSIDWKLFDSGGSVNEAVVARSVDIGLVGSSAASRGLSTGITYQVPWIFDVIGKAEALVVKGEKGIESIADLKGKTIATPFASTSHYSLLAALKDAGLSERDVKIIDSEPDAIFAAWSHGDIDGAYVWNPNLTALVKEGGKTLITSADLARKGTTTYDVGVVTNDFAGRYPAAVQTWLNAQNAAVHLITTKAEEAAAAIGAELNIPPAEVTSQLAGLAFVDAKKQAGAGYLGGGLAANLFASAEFNKTLGKIPSVQDESAYKQAVVTRFAAGAK
jgi:taurine transport system substrate-binding protein